MLTIDNVTHSYVTPSEQVDALRDVSLEVQEGSFVAVVGPSGSGKSTLLTIAGGLQPAGAGTVEVCGVELGGLSEDALCEHRRRHVGFVFQDFNLVQLMTAVENVALPLVLEGVARQDAHEQASTALQRVGLASEVDRFPDELSGGQQQRVAIARALCGQGPRLLMADEPTGALDTKTADGVMSLIDELIVEDCAAVVATHDPRVAARADRVVELVDGAVAREYAPATS